MIEKLNFLREPVERTRPMRILLAIFLLGILTNLVFAGEGGGDAESRAGGRQQKFVGAADDPILQAIGALPDARLRDEIVEAAEAYYSSRFADAHTRIAAVMKQYPESAIGDVLYDFLLLMDGAALGFSGECGPAIETLNRLQARIEHRAGDPDPDTLAGIMSLKIDILQAGGDVDAAVNEMDALIARFGGGDMPNVRWRVENTMQHKALLLEQNGKPEQAAAAYRAFAEKLSSAGELDATKKKRLDMALHKLEELERGAGSEEAGERGREPRL